jgi:hypothetical protein
MKLSMVFWSVGLLKMCDLQQNFAKFASFANLLELVYRRKVMLVPVGFEVKVPSQNAFFQTQLAFHLTLFFHGNHRDLS